MSLSAGITPNPDNRSMDINAAPARKWTRNSGADAQGTFRHHTITVRDKDNAEHTFSFKIRGADALTEVIALKSFKSMVKTLSTEETRFLQSHLKAGNTPQVKIVKDKEGKILGAVPVFPGTPENPTPFCYLKDGSKLLLTRDDRAWYQKMTGQGVLWDRDYTGPALDASAVGKVILEHFVGDRVDELVHKFSKLQEGHLGYDIAVQHKHTFKAPLGQLAEQFQETRMDRAKAILAMLEEGDESSIEADKEEGDKSPDPKLTITPTGTSGESRQVIVEDLPEE
jgi:hypothetical protein